MTVIIVLNNLLLLRAQSANMNTTCTEIKENPESGIEFSMSKQMMTEFAKLRHLVKGS